MWVHYLFKKLRCDGKKLICCATKKDILIILEDFMDFLILFLIILILENELLIPSFSLCCINYNFFLMIKR